MKYSDLRDFISQLQRMGELKPISVPVAPYLEMTEVCDRTLRAAGPALLFQNPTGMPYDVAATAWGHMIGCKTWNPGVIDALRAFRLAYTFKAPETAYPGPE